MSYTQSEVQEMLNKIGKIQNEFRGKVDLRFNEYDKEISDLQSQNNAFEKALALSSAPSGGRLFQPNSGFANLGEFALSVVEAGRPGGQIDQRLLKIQAASGGSEGIPSEGGFLVGQDLLAPLVDGVFETGQLAKRCFRLPVSANANSLKIPAVDETSRANGSRFGGIQTYWAAEAATVTATKPKYRSMELNLHKLFAISYATDELLQDAVALGRILDQSFRDEFAFKIDDAIIRGTGSGQPLGILNSGCLVSVAKETGQAAATLVFENILKMYSRMLPRSRKTAAWLINQSVEPQLFGMSLAVGTGGVPVYLPASGAAGSPYASLFGLPVICCEQCSALGDQGDIILADLSSYILADKGGIQAASSIHVQFIYDEMTFRWTYRLDGQPLFASSISPYKGSDALSPFVTLDERA